MTNCRIAPRYFDHTANPHLPSLRIDFSRSTSGVFQDFTKYVLNRDGHLGLLVGHAPPLADRNDLDLPSWCPDYRDFRSHRTSSLSLRDTGHCKPQLEEFRIERHSEQDLGRLSVHGVKIAEVVDEDLTGRQHSGSSDSTYEFLISTRNYRHGDDLGRYVTQTHNRPDLTYKKLKFPPEVGMYVSRTPEENWQLLNVDRLNRGDMLIICRAHRSFRLCAPHMKILILRPSSGDFFQYVDQATSDANSTSSTLFHDGRLESLFGQTAEALDKIYDNPAQDFVIV